MRKQNGKGIVVAAPPMIATALTAPWLDVVSWDGGGDVPRPDVQVWVPPYVVGSLTLDVHEVLDQLPDLRVVQLLSAGVEPWPALLPHSVTLCAGRTVHGGSTAELAVALTLSLLRDLPRYADQQARQLWLRHQPQSIAGKTVLILGAGDVGVAAATVFRALDAHVTLAGRVARDTAVSQDDALRSLPEVEVLLIALPLTESTRGLVGKDWLGALPDGAIVVQRGSRSDPQDRRARHRGELGAPARGIGRH